MDKYTDPKFCSLPNADKLRSALAAGEGSGARNLISALFDDASFIELGAYTKRGFSDFLATEKSNEFEGVICGYGAIDGKLTFAFAQDSSRMGGAIDERHAKKIADLYALAIKNGAPVVGIFDSNGTDIFAGVSGLSAYGRIMASVSAASGVIPQIALVSGKCLGLAAAITAMFDFTFKTSDADLYVSSPRFTGAEGAQDSLVAFSADASQCLGYIRAMISFLPMNSDTGIMVESATDNINKMIGELDFAGDAHAIITSIADNGVSYPVWDDFAKSVTVAFATVAGVKCGIVASSFASNEGRIDAPSARKISRFVNFCNSFSIPLVTVVDSNGVVIDKDNEVNFFAPELAKLAAAYATANVPKVTVISGHAIGAAFVLLGSRSLGADIVYATDNSEICALSADSGVAFAWDKYITLENTREKLIDEWKTSVSSPARAAESGDIDDIISTNELRARICSALLMLCAKGQNAIVGRKVLPL